MSTSRVFTVGQVLTAAQMNDLPQGVLGKTITNTDSAGIGATETDILTAPAVTIAGANRRIRIRFHARNVQGTVVNDGFLLRIKEGTTILQELQWVVASTVGSGVDFEAIVDSPSAASHTYKVTFQRFTGTGTAFISAGTSPVAMTIYVEDAGAV